MREKKKKKRKESVNKPYIQVHRDSPIALTPSSWFQYGVLGIIHSSYEVFSAADVIFVCVCVCAFVVFACQRACSGEKKKEGASSARIFFFFFF